MASLGYVSDSVGIGRQGRTGLQGSVEEHKHASKKEESPLKISDWLHTIWTDSLPYPPPEQNATPTSEQRVQSAQYHKQQILVHNRARTLGVCQPHGGHRYGRVVNAESIAQFRTTI